MKHSLPFVALLALSPCLVAAPCRADLIKQGASYSRTVLMTDSADHISGKTGLTGFVVNESKAGGAAVAVTPTVTETGGGRYRIALTSTDTGTLGALDLTITATGADPSDTHDQIVAFDPNDAAALGLTGVASAATQSTVAAANTGTIISNQAANVTTLTAAINTRSAPATPQTISLATPLQSSPAQGTIGVPFNAMSQLSFGAGSAVQTDAGALLTALLNGGRTAFTAAALANAATGSGGGAGPTAVQIRQEIDADSTQLQSLVTGQAAQASALAALPGAITAALLAAPVDGSVTLKQQAAIDLAVDAGAYSIGALNTTGHTRVYTYYRQGGTTVLATSTVQYASDNATSLSRAVVFSNLP